MYPWDPFRYHDYTRRDPALRGGERPNWLRTLRGETKRPRPAQPARLFPAKPQYVAYQGAR